MISRQHPLVKATSYVLLGLLGAGVRMWSPPEALVICTVAWAADGLISSLVPYLRTMGKTSARLVAFVIPLGSLLMGRGLAAFLGLG